MTSMTWPRPSSARESEGGSGRETVGAETWRAHTHVESER